MTARRTTCLLSLFILLALSTTLPAQSEPVPASATGSVKIILQPQEAIDDGIEWTLDFSTYNKSGETQSLVAPGTYDVHFAGAGWDKVGVQVTVIASQTTEKTVTLEEVKGWATVNINPAEAAAQNPRWSPDGGTTWYDDGEKAELREGTHQVTFSEIDFYDVPSPLDIIVQESSHDEWDASYSQRAGGLQIFLKPDEIAASAGWRMQGDTTWRDSGYTYTPYGAGPYTIEFKDVINYSKPTQTTYNLYGESAVDTYTAAYTANEATLTVNITDDDPGRNVNNEGAKWSMHIDGIWRDSGDTVVVTAPDTVIVKFKDVDGWSTPKLVTVDLNPDDAKEFAREYKRSGGHYAGTVIDEYGNPLTGVTIQVSLKDGSFVTSTTVDGNGEFLIRGLQPGIIHYFRAIKQNYTFVPDPYFEYTRNLETQNFQFKGTYEPSDLTISGEVLSTNGQPVEGAVISLFDQQSARAVTDSQGQYRFEGLSSGTYKVTNYGADGYFAQENDSQTVTLDNESINDVNFDLRPAGLKITGEVFNYNYSEHITDVDIRLTGPFDIQMTRPVNDDGFFAFRDLPAGDYTLRVLDNTRLYKARELMVKLVDRNLPLNNFIEKLPEESSIKIGGLTVFADKILKVSDDIYKTEGLAYLGAHLMVQTEAPLTIDRLKQEIRGNGKVTAPAVPNVGTLTFFDGEFAINSENFPLTRTFEFEFGGIKFFLDAAENTDERLLLKALFKLNIAVVSIQAEAGFATTAEGTSLEYLKAKAGQKFKIKDWGLTDVELLLDIENQQFGGGAKLVTPIIALGAYLDFYEGVLNSVGVKISKEIPIHAPVLYFSGISGRISNMSNPDKPIEFNAGLGIGAGPKLGHWRMVDASGTISVKVSGSFLATVVAKFFGIEVGWVKIIYEHLPAPFFSFDGKFEFGDIIFIRGDAEVNMYFQPFMAWGLVAVSAEYRANIAGEVVEEPLLGTGAELTSENLRMWATLFGATLEAVIDGDGFRITKPDWLNGIRISFSEDGRLVARSPMMKQSRGAYAVPPNSKDSHQVPEETESLNLMVSWRGEEGLTPTIIDPDGMRYTGAKPGNGYTFVRIHDRAVSYTFQRPASGEWRIAFDGGDVRNFSSYATLYEPLPGVAIETVEKTGPAMFEITLSRSGFEDEAVQLFYGPVGGEDELRAIATHEQLGADTTWEWDASTLPGGNYYVYARVNNGERRPFTYRYQAPVSIDVDPALAVYGRPGLEAADGGMKVFWNPVEGVDVDYYRVYFTGNFDDPGYSSYVDFPGTDASGIIDIEEMPPGRRYRIAVAARLEDGTEGAISDPRRFRYKSKNANNVPFFTGSPDGRVETGEEYTFDPKARDFDKDSLQYFLLEAPGGTSMNPENGRISWIPDDDQAGYNFFLLQVEDGQGGAEQIGWNVFVGDVSTTGILDARRITTAAGEKAYVLAYWNPHLNRDQQRPETLEGRLGAASLGDAGLPVRFSESGNNSGYFSAVVTESDVRNVRKAAGISPTGQTTGGEVVVELTGPNRRERAIIRFGGR